ncbi:MAG: putative enoyl-CoA hydratase/isomerase family protein [Acidimicrobiaceae bacterium]|nr:putative enoyl-CoA hydratase/isomerase family protein [Acidimicrobiaceae bacterium]
MDIWLQHEASVAILTWDDGENRINLDSLGALHQRLDELEATTGPLAVVLTGTGKFFSNGLDLARFAGSPIEFRETLKELKRTIGRLFVYPAFTVAALNGHAFAGGALITLGFDYRVMREDRGYWCMNEAEIGLALDEQLFSILEHRLPKATARVAVFTAKRFSGPDALAAGIVEATTSEDQVVRQAIDMAESYVMADRKILAQHKRHAHGAEAAFLGFDN